MDAKEFVDDLYAQSQLWSTLSGEDRLKQWSAREYVDRFWSLAIEQGIAFINELRCELRVQSNVQRFQTFECNLRNHWDCDLQSYLFCLPGVEFVQNAIAHTPPQALKDEFAAKVAQYQSPEVILNLFRLYGHKKALYRFLQCLYGECIYRHAQLIHQALLTDFFKREIEPYWRHRLPPHATLLESEVILIHHGYGAGTKSLKTPGFGEMDAREVMIEVPSSVNRTIGPDKDTHPARASIVNWLEYSNAEVMVRSQAYPEGANSLSILGSLIAAMSDLSMEGEPAIAKRVSAPYAFSLLFGAALGGGAYSPWQCAIDARPAAWNSFEGFLAPKESLPWEDIVQMGTAAEWWVFSPSSDWFMQLGWDLWLACLNPQTLKATMLAITDSD